MLARRRSFLTSLLGLACGSAPPGAGTTGEPESTGPAPSGGSTSAAMPSTSGSTTAEPHDGTTTGATGTSRGTTDDGDDEPTGPVLDVAIPDTPAVPPRTPPWLVHMANVDGARHLYRVDIETAVATDVCTMIDAATMLPYGGSTPSVTFTRDDRLIFSTGTALYELELPSCMATELGSIGFSGVNGICPDEADDLYGLSSTSNALLHIDAQTGVGTEVGSLGRDWGSLGATWNDVDQQMLGIEANTDGLYEIDTTTGLASLQQQLPLNFMGVGMEFHPLTGQIYMCTADSHLYRLEADGTISDLGDMGFSGCTNLGAPWSESVELPTPS